MTAVHCIPHGAARRACLLALGLAAFWPAPAAGAAEGRARPDLASFRLVTERNIFNASRTGGGSEASRETRRPARVDAFGLVGVMSYAKGTFAFFDGSGSDYRKALQPGGAIAGFELLEILSSAVRLQHGTNSPALELRLGMQMRREEQGEWKLGERTEPFDSAGSGAGGRSDGPARGAGPSVSSTGGSTANDADALQRLLRKREAENP